MNIRHLQLPLALALALGASSAQALGLGPIEVKSGLNQPLVAEIPILSAAPGEIDELEVRRASPEAFARVGLERPVGLTANLQMSVGRNAARVREVMNTFKVSGGYRFEDFDRATFSASRCLDGEIPGIIQRVHRDYGYIVDPHTACAFKEHNPDRVNIAHSTASPAKFPETIRSAIGIEPTHPSLEALKTRAIIKHPKTTEISAIRACNECVVWCAAQGGSSRCPARQLAM